MSKDYQSGKKLIKSLSVLLQNTTLSVYQKHRLQKDWKLKLKDLAIQSILFGKFKTEERDQTVEVLLFI